ncbi:MAG: outer membrane protein assembly factor BamA [Hyphomicrobiales bacterium]|nr:outer membrane protein assembly factor BamA [Hyphomicrobiales bacterium]
MALHVGADRRRRRASCAVVVLSTLLVSVAAAAATEIIVQGSKRVDAEAIRSHFRPAPAGALDAAALDEGLKELYATGAFEDVRISRSGTRVIVTVVEAPLIDRIGFEGNKKLKDEDLTKAMSLRSRSALTRAAVQADVANLNELYRRTGRYGATIKPKTIRRGEGRVDLVFEIDEGAKTGIKQIAFVGNGAFGSERLKSIIASSESGWFGFLKTSDVYDPARVDSDSELLRRFYTKNGFADAQVSAAGRYDESRRGVVLTFTLDEGQRYRIGAISIASESKLDTAPFRPLIEVGSGDTYNRETIDRSVDALAIALGRAGHPFLSVRPKLTRNPGAGTVDLAFVLEERSRQYVERIVVHGNGATREEVIRRELDLGEGDAFNRALVERAERRLKALGLFKTVRIAGEPGSAPDRVVLRVEIEEEKTGDFNIAGGYSSADGLLAEVGVSEKSFLGRGQYIKVAATAGQYVRGATLGVVEPYFLGSRAALGADLSFRETLTSTNQSYGSSSYGAAVRVLAPVTDTLGTEMRYSLTRKTFSLAPSLMDCAPTNPPPGCFANGEASAAVKQAVLDGPAWTSAAGTTVAYRALDNPRNPHDGLRADLSQDVAGLGGGMKFLRSTMDGRYYKSFGDEVVGMARFQGGTVSPYGGQALPLAASFFGGPQLVRGFAPNGFGPRDITPGTTMDSIGGSMYWASTMQLMAPVPGLPTGSALKVGVFADAGSLWGYRGATSFPNLSQSFNPSDSRKIRSSIGASMVWDSPFGPLRVDYAIPTSKASTDITRRLSFGAGLF